MRKRLAAMQDCPLLTVRAATAAAMAVSSEAEGMTMKGSLPPSSRTDFLMSHPACAAMARPVDSLPVTVTAATRSSASTISTWLASMRSVWKLPRGKPARRTRASMASAHWGTLEACLSRPTLPAIRAGARKRKTCQKGKFQGMTARMTPSGSQRTVASRGGASSGSGARMRAAFAA